jgi:glucose-6-phosphate 1-dehydrogenase
MAAMTETQVQENPLLEGLGPRRAPEPCVLVIFGASGDLTHRKIFPALYALAMRKLLPPNFAIVGAARSDWTEDEFRNQMEHAVREFGRDDFDQDVWDWLAKATRYISLDFADESRENHLMELLDEIDEERGTRGNRVYYLAVPPQVTPTIVRELGEHQKSEGWMRLIVEKPFGHDLASARELTSLIGEHFTEEEVFRIDHYLGKETVQNMLALRFANGIFEPIWNNRYVDHVQITGAETVGVEARGGYFEQAGSMRDMVQNHLLQVLSLFAMEPPIAFDPDAVRDEKLKVLKALRQIPEGDFAQQVVRAQYVAGSTAGQAVPGYREEKNVSPTSTTETFVALKLFIDSWRWAGVPFYLRSGKRLPKRVTEIAVHFKEAPHLLFGRRGESIRPNVLAIRIQPDEGIALNFGSKLPGPAMEVAPVSMEFRYGSSFGVEPPEAYERLILDCLLGDSTLFTRADEVEASWTWVSRIHRRWADEAAAGRANLATYPAGSWGPPAADQLLAADGRAWRLP